MINGFDPNLVLYKKKFEIKKFLCFYCKYILKDPLICSSCNKYFCNECYDEINNLSLDKCCNTSKINEIEKSINNKFLIELCQINFKCKNFNEGCKKIFYYENIIEHENLCDCEYVICIFMNCNLKILKKNLENHLNTCKYKLYECNFCYNKIENINLKDHSNNCLLKPKICKYCKKSFKQKELEDHIYNCDFNIKICEICNIKLKNNLFMSHKEVDCLKFQINNYYNLFNKKMIYYKEKLKILHSRFIIKNEFINLICKNCRKFSCEIKLYTCSECNYKYCIKCNHNYNLCKTNFKNLIK